MTREQLENEKRIEERISGTTAAAERQRQEAENYRLLREFFQRADGGMWHDFHQKWPTLDDAVAAILSARQEAGKCSHNRTDEDGICRACGADRRGI